MKNILIVIVVLMLGGLAYYFLVMRPSVSEVEITRPAVITQPPVVQQDEVVTLPEEVTETRPVEELPAKPEVEPLPSLSLDESDPVVLESLSGLIGEATVMQYLVTDNVIARVVASLDALTSRQLSPNLLPLQAPGGELQVTEDTNPENPIISPEGDPVREYLVDPVNYQRYTRYVELLESIDTDQLLAHYFEHQALFQQAFVELGYPEGDFNTRLLEVIDHLLQTPEMAKPVRLIKPEAYYQFADPQLEALSAGQKLMIRMGSSNAQRVKSKLIETRARLVAANP